MINGFKKEFMFFSRGGRLAAVIIVMVALALMSPVMFGFTSQMMQVMKDAMPDESYSQLADEFSSFSASDIVMYNIEYIAGIGSIVLLFIFKSAAGGEQKKRSVIIPQCAGLTAERYALPKFIIYPVSVFVVTIISVMAGAGAATLIFPGGLDWNMVWLSAVCAGVYLAFSTAVQFCIGICVGRSNVAVAAVIIMQMTLPTILGFFRVDRFNPFALNSISLAAARKSGESGSVLLSSLESVSQSDDVTALNVIVSLGTALVISGLLYFVTVFALHTQEVNNEGNEPVL
ncbi:MAG: hypothetical protein IK990_03140 [Ruminiclostridium sp.]|nr:hypothetical protein [Ruminiclostridium sp.]